MMDGPPVSVTGVPPVEKMIFIAASNIMRLNVLLVSFTMSRKVTGCLLLAVPKVPEPIITAIVSAASQCIEIKSGPINVVSTPLIFVAKVTLALKLHPGQALKPRFAISPLAPDGIVSLCKMAFPPPVAKHSQIVWVVVELVEEELVVELLELVEVVELDVVVVVLIGGGGQTPGSVTQGAGWQKPKLGTNS